ncbi:MAG: hypothetical protein CMJ47_01105 [Planctomyces sp.]|nr:hypothetical protein [Planctomyces sp.]
MNKLLRTQIEHMIRSKTDNDFQEFVVFLHQLVFGDAFRVVKQKHDKGSDGIVNGNTVLAVYGPTSYTLPGFKKKVGDDHKSYCRNWQETHPNWTVVFNDELKANMIQFVEKLHPGADKKGLPELLVMIEDLPWSKIQRVGEYFGIPSQLLMNDLIGQVIDDLIRQNEVDTENDGRQQATYIEDKIALNYSAEEVQHATDEYYDCLLLFNSTESILREHSALSLQALRSRIRNDFRSQGGSFAERFRGLVTLYSQAQRDDDLYRFAVTTLLTFFFEQCLIGRRTPEEESC